MSKKRGRYFLKQIQVLEFKTKKARLKCIADKTEDDFLFSKEYDDLKKKKETHWVWTPPGHGERVIEANWLYIVDLGAVKDE